MTLRWPGNRQAKEEADAAYRKMLESTKRKRSKHRCPKKPSTPPARRTAAINIDQPIRE